MNTIEVPERGHKFNIPSHLGECTPEEYVDICELLFRYQSGEIDYLQFRYAAVYRFLNMVPKNKKLSEVQEQDMNSNIYMISELIDDFFVKDEDGQLIIRQEYYHNPIPTIPLPIGSYYGPQDYLRDVTFGQYVDALNIFATYAVHTEPELLYNLAAIFYRKKGIKYKSSDIENRTKKLQHTGFGYIYGVYLFLASFQHYITSATVTWEGKKLDLSILFKSHNTDSSSASSMPGLGMKATAFSLAESGVLGTLKNVNNTNLWEVLLLMYDVRKNDIESKQRAKDSQTN
jgi:hypothetical protein